MPKEVAKEKEDVGLDGDAAQRKKLFNKTTPIERYSFRLKCRCKDPVLAAELPRMSLLRFTSEINFNETGICRMLRPRVINMKPYLQLDLRKPTAARHARMALRLLRPWSGPGQDPMHFGEDTALQALEIFVQSEDCPRWVKKRFEYQNRERQTRAPQARR